MKKSPSVIPHSFVLEELDEVSPLTKPIFGARGVYVQGKIVFILRESEKHIEDNGVWLATTQEHHASLQKEFPNMRSLKMFGPGPTGWQLLPMDAEDFEESVLRACEIVRNFDPRIGKIPKGRGIRKKLGKKKVAKKVAKKKGS